MKPLSKTTDIYYSIQITEAERQIIVTALQEHSSYIAPDITGDEYRERPEVEKLTEEFVCIQDNNLYTAGG